MLENCQKIQIEKFLNECREKFKQSLISSELKMIGIDIELTTSKTNFNGIRFWFKCPQCKRRVGVLFKHYISEIIGCRVCLDLNYRKQRYKGMIEGK